MRIFLAIIFLSFPFSILLAQEECSKLKSNCQKQKSNTLSISQISLSEKYDVHYYSIDVSLTNLSTAISGTVEIHAKSRVFLDSALLELFPTFNITQIRVDNSPVSFSRQSSAIKVPVNSQINQSFIIAIDYNGTPPNTGTNPMGGSGLTSKIETAYNKQVTASLSEPFSAYEWWPCKQSLSDKADSCSVKITVPNTCKAGSNGILQNVIDLGNGTSRYEWKHKHPIAYYLISVAVGEYIDYSIYSNPIGSPNPILIQNYIYDSPECLINNKLNIDKTSDYLELYSKLFGLYPFYDEKYGHCMAPIGGGMEHQTMTTQVHFDKNLTAHELGHQWFGDNVTCASWADIWVNEGFATYSQYLMLENLFPNERKLQMENYHSAAMQYNDGSVYVDDTLSAHRIFDYRLTYAKGASIINTMRFVINNDDLFFQGLKDYQTNFGDSLATGQDVKTSLEKASGKDLTKIFDEWYYGQGFPTYNIKWNTIGYDLSLQIDQRPSGAFITQKFTNPLEISFSRENKSDTTIRFEIYELSNQFLIRNIGRVNNVIEVDPYNWIINKMDSIFHDSYFEVSPKLEDHIYEDELKISPNPTKGEFMMIAKSPGKHSFKIIDSKGKLIKDGEFEKDIILDIYTYSQGVYLIQVKSEFGDIQTRRIVKN